MAPANGVHAGCAWIKEPGPWIVTQTFGPTSLVGEPMCNGSRTHRGLDLGVPAGNHSMIATALTGKFKVNTIPVASSGGYGNLVIVRSVPHGNDLVDVYMAHHSELIVRDGDTVGAGSLLGVTGSTGFSTGPHVHFEVRPKGSGNTCSSIDPTDVMQDPTGSGSAQTTNVDLLNGGINLDPLAGVSQALTTAEQSFERTLVGLSTGTIGLALFGSGTAATFFMMKGSAPNLGAVKQFLTPAPPPAAPAPTPPANIPRFTPAEQQWNPRKMPAPVPPPQQSTPPLPSTRWSTATQAAEGIARKMRAGKALSAQEVAWGNQNSRLIGIALGKMA